MKILLTNDDGINADGLQILRKTLSSSHDVFVIAPDRERSACSNIFTMREELVVTKHDKNSYAISGYPADCVSIGLHSDVIPEIDIVISGINHGPNLGDDIHFSGTVAGARTAFIFDRPSIAISLDSFHTSSPFLADTADFILDYINTETIFEEVYLNINYPNIPKNEIKGVKYTCLSRRSYIDSYVKTQQNNPDQFTMRLNGTIETKDTPCSDSFAVENSYISITPMTIDSTDHRVLSKYQK